MGRFGVKKHFHGAVRIRGRVLSWMMTTSFILFSLASFCVRFATTGEAWTGQTSAVSLVLYVGSNGR